LNAVLEFLALKVLIVGSGVVGQKTGIGLIQMNNDVFFHDVNKRVLQDLSLNGYPVINDLSEFDSNSPPMVLMVCVPTPSIDGKMDKKYIQKAVRGIGKFLKKARQYHVVVIRSTVVPLTTRTQIIPLLEKYSGREVGKDFGVCVNPEFLRQQNALEDFLHPWRIVIGEYDKRSGDVLECLYNKFNAPIFRTGIDTAEMIKYVANIFLATKISFFNEIYLICEKLGLDAHFISSVAALDPRIGSYGTLGGRPFEGSCLPKDLEAFISFMKDQKLDLPLLHAVQFINNMMRKNAEETNDKLTTII
jgi:UDPglucose 6-dehydrogenase